VDPTPAEVPVDTAELEQLPERSDSEAPSQLGPCRATCQGGVTCYGVSFVTVTVPL
jgi:hypothetical protein